MAEAPPLWSPEDFLAAAGGRLVGAAPRAVTGISIDSRTLNPGDAFFAIRGENRDGHAFVADAVAKGAAIAVVASSRVKEQSGGPLLAVDDPLTALENVARAARARSLARIVAITGSVGKTGTKAALATALAASGETHASAASYNNQWGVPLSLALMPASARFGIFEVGMNHAGEIAPLARMIRPHVAIITTVAPVHLGHFASVDEIAAAKAEIFVGLEGAGTAILNRDNAYFDFLSSRARAAGAGRIIGFGEDERAEARLVKVALLPDCSTVTADILGLRTTYKIGAPGKHLVLNSLAVLAAVREAGGDLARGAMALADWSAPAGRGSRHVFATPLGDVTIVDESYNANPASMRAAIATLGQAEPGPHGRRIAVLGDMLELGEDAAELHAGLAKPLADARIDLVYTAGPLMTALRDALPAQMRAAYADESAGLETALLRDVRAGDVVMVKGSLGSRMSPLVQALKRRFAAQCAPAPLAQRDG